MKNVNSFCEERRQIQMKKVLPGWCKEVKKALIDKDMNINDLANELKYSREYISIVINGRLNSPEMQKQICDYLGVASE